MAIIENDDDVLIKVEFAGLCGTDIHIVEVELSFFKRTNTVSNSIFHKLENFVLT